MKERARARRGKTSSIRQSVTIPAPLAAAVRGVAKERHLTMSRALVEMAQRGVEAEMATHDNLEASYHRFMSTGDSAGKGEAGKDLIREIFGKGAIAEDPVL